MTYKIVTVILLMSLSAMASTYHVAVDGSDLNSGDKQFPFATVQKGVNTAIAGDSVFIAEGIFIEKVNFPNSGLIADPIVILGFGDVIIKGNSAVTVWSGVLNIQNKKNISIQNIQVHDSYWFGFNIDNGSENISLLNCKTFNTGASGIYAARSISIFADSNIVRKACYQSLSIGSQECISIVSVDNFRLSANEVYESGGSTNGGEGIDTKEGCKNGIVINNYVHDLNRLGIYVDAWDNICENIQIYNNRVSDCASGIALSSENGGIVRNILIYNNLVFKSRLYGIVISAWEKNGLRHNIIIANNTCYKNGSGTWGGGIIIEEKANADSIVIVNNLCLENYLWGISVYPQFEKNVLNNLTYPYIGYPWTNEVKGSNSVNSDPLLENPVNSDFRLKSNSPAIGKGNSIFAPEFDYQIKLRNKCCTDIGAYQFSGDPTGFKTVSQKATFLFAYLNPENQELIIKNSNNSNPEIYIDILSSAGLLMHSELLSITQPFSLKNFTTGCYLVKIRCKEENMILRVLR